MTTTQTSKAYNLGKAAFEAGLKNAPTLDPALVAILNPEVGSYITTMKAWQMGWQDANIAAPW